MTLSEAVKAAGIGGRVRRIGPGLNEFPVSGGLMTLLLTHNDLASDDWQVVQRAPREMRLCAHPGGWFHLTGVGMPCSGEAMSRCQCGERDHVTFREVVE